MASSNSGVEALIGTWEHVRSENFGDFLKAMGLPKPLRMLAKSLNIRIIISESNGIWTLRAEAPLKTKSFSFKPDVEFDDNMIGGDDMKTIVHFENGQWIQTYYLKDGRQTTITRYVDGEGLQQIDMICGNVKAHRCFKRTK